MQNKIPKGITPYNSGFFPEIGLRIKLIYRLMTDRRVSILLKALPVASLVYLVLPEFFPVVDDAIILWLGSYLFVELCPDEIVDEHMKKLRHVEIPAETAAHSTPAQETIKGEVIDAEFSEVNEE